MSFKIRTVLNNINNTVVSGAAGAGGAQGRQGNAGAPGAPGAPGTNGLQGLQGFLGIPGTNGTDGLQGLQGLPGSNTGLQGYQGLQGIQGFIGLQGYLGSQGFVGIQGTPGGTQGYVGTQGFVGFQGFDGYIGSDGPQGLEGPIGPSGGPTGPTGPEGTIPVDPVVDTLHVVNAFSQGVTGVPGSTGTFFFTPNTKGANTVEGCEQILDETSVETYGALSFTSDNQAGYVMSTNVVGATAYPASGATAYKAFGNVGDTGFYSLYYGRNGNPITPLGTAGAQGNLMPSTPVTVVDNVGYTGYSVTIKLPSPIYPTTFVTDVNVENLVGQTVKTYVIAGSNDNITYNLLANVTSAQSVNNIDVLPQRLYSYFRIIVTSVTASSATSSFLPLEPMTSIAGSVDQFGTTTAITSGLPTVTTAWQAFDDNVSTFCPVVGYSSTTGLYTGTASTVYYSNLTSGTTLTSSGAWIQLNLSRPVIISGTTATATVQNTSGDSLNPTAKILVSPNGTIWYDSSLFSNQQGGACAYIRYIINSVTTSTTFSTTLRIISLQFRGFFQDGVYIQNTVVNGQLPSNQQVYIPQSLEVGLATDMSSGQLWTDSTLLVNGTTTTTGEAGFMTGATGSGIYLTRDYVNDQTSIFMNSYKQFDNYFDTAITSVGGTGISGNTGATGGGVLQLISKTTNITGNAIVDGTMSAKNTTVNGTLATTGNTTVGGNLTVSSITFSQPVGSIIMYAGGTVPTNWLFCDGTAYSRTTYASLFTVISTTYGVGDGTSTFNVPNFQNKLPYGKASTTTLGTIGGTGNIVLTAANLPPHTHTYNASSGVVEVSENTVGNRFPYISTSSTASGSGPGTSTSFSILNPYITINYIIKWA